MEKTELQVKMDILTQEADFLKTLYDMVREAVSDRPLLPTLPTKEKSFPMLKSAVTGLADWLVLKSAVTGLADWLTG